MEFILAVYVISCLLLLVLLTINVKVVQKSSANKWDPIKFILSFPILLLMFLVMILILPLGKLIQVLISGVLKIKYGDEYYGVMKGTDLAMGCNNWQYSFIKSLIIIEYNKSIATKSVFEYIKDKTEKNRSENKFHNKFFSTLDQSLGYFFFRKSDIKISDCVREMPLSKNVIDRTELMILLRKCLSKSLPVDGAGLWDIHVGTQPLKWRPNSDPNIEYYPLLVRTHHGIADGTSLLKLLRLLFEDEPNLKISKPDFLVTLQPKKSSRILTAIKKTYAFLNIILLFVSAMYITLFLRGQDKNDLHGKPFRKDELLQFVTDEAGVYYKKVKRIKKLHGNISFSEILIAAYSASLNEYYQKYSSSCPESVTLSLPIIRNYDQLKGITSGEINVDNVDVSNNFILLQMHVPICILKDKDFHSKIPCISRLNIIRNVTNNLRTTSMLQFSYILVDQFLGSLPCWVAKVFLGTINSTTVGSFLPGPSKFSICNGALAASDCLFWLPHIVQIGIGFTTLTYDDRLLMGLSCNGQIDDQSHVDEILNNVLKHIDLIEQELESYFKIN